MLPALAAEHRVFAPTLPGHSGGPPLAQDRPLDVDGIVDAVEGLLDAEGIETGHLVGNSGGGWLALALAARGRARSVTALAPGGGWEPGSRTDRRVRRFFVRGQFVGRRTARSFEAIAARPRLRAIALRDVVARPERLSADAALAMLRGAAECELAEPFLALWARGAFPPAPPPVDCPVRVAWGTHDRVLPAARCSARFAALQDAEWILIPGAGHVPMHDEPERVAATVLDLTRRVDG